MQAKKLLIRSAIAIVGLFLVGFGVLTVHVYQATHKQKSDYEMRQMGRIDFKQAISAEQSTHIKSLVGNMPGVTHTFFNQQNGILVYSFTQGKQTSTQILQTVTKNGYKAQLYSVSEKDMMQGCPAIGNKNTFRYKFTQFIAQL